MKLFIKLVLAMILYLHFSCEIPPRKLEEKTISTNYDKILDSLNKKMPRLLTSEERLAKMTNEQLADSFLMGSFSTDFFELCYTKQWDRALEVLALAETKTIQPNLLSMAKHHREEILFNKRNNFDYSYRLEHIIFFEKGGKYGILSKDEKVIFEAIFDEIDEFDHVILTEKDKKFGLLDTKGKELFKPMFTQIEPDFFVPLILIEDNKKYGFLDKFGKVLIYPKYSEVGGIYNDQIITVKEQKWGAINILAKETIPMKFDSIGDFDDEMIAPAILNKEDVFINKKGEVVSD